MKRMLIITPVIALFSMGSGAIAQSAPAGAGAGPCDPAQFTPIMSSDGTRILYWNNRSCPAASGAVLVPASAPDLPEQPEAPEETPDEADDENGRDKGKGWNGKGGDDKSGHKYGGSNRGNKGGYGRGGNRGGSKGGYGGGSMGGR